MTRRVARISLRRKGLLRCACSIMSTRRPSRADSSSLMRLWSKTLQSASLANVARTSRSLSGLKSLRKADPNIASSLIFHLRQNPSITWFGISKDNSEIMIAIFSSAILPAQAYSGYSTNRTRDQKRRTRGQTSDQCSLQRTAQWARASEASFDKTKYEKRNQRYRD